MKLSEVACQVMWNRLISVVEEQAQALVRTAFSTSVREAGDLSAGVYNDKGEMLAQAVTGTPGHVNAMADAVPHFIRHIGRQKCRSDSVRRKLPRPVVDRNVPPLQRRPQPGGAADRLNMPAKAEAGHIRHCMGRRQDRGFAVLGPFHR